MSLRYPDSYTPREQFSPSGLDLLSRCGRAWFKRYMRGIKEDDLVTWDDAQHLVAPEPPEKGAAAVRWAEYRDAKKEYNRLTKRALGHALHHAMQVYLDWHPPLVDVWRDGDWGQVCALATAGIFYLPPMKQIEWLHTELEVSLDFAGVKHDARGYVEPLRIFGFVDVVLKLKASGRIKVVDYKSTGNLDWAPTPDELREDVALCIYALAVMVALKLEEVDCLWIYFCTDPESKPDAWAVEVTVTREHCIDLLAEHERWAKQALHAMLWWQDPVKPLLERSTEFRTLTVLQQNNEACGDYGGCVYHHERGGDCKPPRLTAGQSIRLDQQKKQLLERRRLFRRSHAGPRQQAERSTSAPRGRKQQRERSMAERSMRDRLAAAEGSENEGEESGGRGGSRGGGGEKESRQTRTRAPATETREPRRARGKKGPNLAILVQGEGDEPDLTIPLVPGTPAYERAVKIVDAITE